MRDEHRVTNPSRIRDHLANERTFLAWIRTSISMMGFGFLAAKLRFEPLISEADTGIISSSTLGVLLAFVGIISVMLAAWRYVSVTRMIDEGEYRPYAYRMLIFAFLIAGIGVAIILNLVWRIPVGQ